MKSLLLRKVTLEQAAVGLFDQLERLTYECLVGGFVCEAELVGFLDRIGMPDQRLLVVILLQFVLSKILYFLGLIDPQPLIQTSLLDHGEQVLRMLVVKARILQ